MFHIAKEMAHNKTVRFGRVVPKCFLDAMARAFKQYLSWRNPELSVGDIP